MNEMVISALQTHYEITFPLKSVPRILLIGHEKATKGYERYAKYGVEYGYKHSVFQFTLKGKGYFEDQSGEYELPPGTGFLSTYTDRDMGYWADAHSDKEPWEFLFVDFDGGHTLQITKEMMKKFGPVYSLPLDAPLITRLLDIAVEPSRTCTANPIESALLVYELLNNLFESFTMHALTKTNFLVAEAFKQISDQPDRFLTVSELADQLQVSREHLTRIFKEHLKKTPHDCILIEKMKRACYLLKTTRLTNDEVAAKLGYSTTNLYLTHFKKFVGVTPKQYRMNLLEGHDLIYKMFNSKLSDNPSAIELH
ncbi:helix-turn-helix domain-containing protein [Candidatus Sumerlaeota bacterium]|nr:helix-turn-helix domain-containing protein [Candidatus Sumerlaeota bacterium]